MRKLMVFNLDEQRYALKLSVVERVFRSVEVTPLPKAPDIVLGVVNISGRVVPVVNIRKRFKMPEREVGLSDHLILAKTSRRMVALIVDSVSDVIEGSEQKTIASENILPNMEYVEGVVKLEDGMVLIHNLDKFLLLEEEERLNDALAR